MSHPNGGETATSSGPPRSPAEAVALGRELSDRGLAIGLPTATSATSWVEESWRDGGALVERVVYRVPMALDAMERPCADCEVGEPHACPTLRERVVVTYG